MCLELETYCASCFNSSVMHFRSWMFLCSQNRTKTMKWSRKVSWLVDTVFQKYFYGSLECRNQRAMGGGTGEWGTLWVGILFLWRFTISHMLRRHKSQAVNTVFAVELVWVEVDWLFVTTKLVLGEGWGLICKWQSVLPEMGFGDLIQTSVSFKVSFLVHSSCFLVPCPLCFSGVGNQGNHIWQGFNDSVLLLHCVLVIYVNVFQSPTSVQCQVCESSYLTGNTAVSQHVWKYMFVIRKVGFFWLLLFVVVVGCCSLFLVEALFHLRICTDILAQ